MTTRSKQAPDLVSSGSHRSRVSAASSRSCSTARDSGWVTVDSGHLGEKGGGPASTAPHPVLRYPAVRDFEHMGLVHRVRNAALFPTERELHQLSRGQRRPLQLLECPDICIPTGQLGLDGRAALN